ncbi:cytochrome P450 [Halieaceae bacterium IMCC14734]|uniref:Cytochrome P450 n=1 Tax=Candidatus Litorirhabdus singularis TaxID=2518993 RepID=A0ABT3TKT4_9GAMM|nr:cytochrome P450 [Candidatus Litorirhabdus singularis]MCX2982019.1 cytochrome P450 [Candidatus Litorirhabdus singularis]
MSHFVPLEVSVFDAAFTLDPYPFIEHLYEQEEVLGFTSEGMNFCFRFEDCHDLIAAHKNVAREPVSVDEAANKLFSENYPARAWHYQYSLTDVKAKALLGRYLTMLLDKLRVDDIERAFSRFRQSGRHDDYMIEVRLLPMRMLLSAWGFTYTDAQLTSLYDDSVALVKSFEHFDNEAMLRKGDEAMSRTRAYVAEQFNNAPAGTLLDEFSRASREAGFDDNDGIASLVTFVQSTPNTLSVSTALMLRNIMRYPDAVAPLRENPDRVSESIIMEFLRRDNHVKALSRQVHNSFTLRGKDLAVGDSLFIFYPGVNMDPTHWDAPLTLNFKREFTRDNHNIFGGSRYSCIGSRIALKYFSYVLPSMLANVDKGSRLIKEEIEVDGEWIAERVITKLPILVP